MSTLLYRLGRFSYRKAWLVIGAWIAVLAGALGVGLGLGGSMQESYTIPGTESQAAIDHLAAVFPEAAGGSAQVVFEAPDGEHVDVGADRAAIDDAVASLAKVPGIVSVLSPFSEYADAAVSDDQRMAIATVQFEQQSYEVTDATLGAVKQAADPARSAGLTVAFGGQVFQDTTFGLSVIEVLGVIFAGVVLVVTFGSLLAAGMPLLVALLGVGITTGGVLAASAFMTVSSASPMLAIMLGLAVGIDYSLFILSRHRNQLAQGADPHESAGTAVATAGSAVVFAGVTVIIALLGLLVVGIPFLSVMGLAAAFAVLLAIGVAVTLIPALLGLAGARLTPKEGSRAWRRAHEQGGGRRTFGSRWVNLVLKAPLAWVIGVVVVLGGLAIPAASLDLNLPTGASDPAGSTSRQAYDMLERGFGPGANGPLIVTVDITQTVDVIDDLDALRDRLATLDDVASVSRGIPNPALDTAIIRVTPESAPDSPETKDLVDSIRALAPSIADELETPIAVTGATAVAVDISDRLSGALLPFALVVVGLSIALLTMVFRSIFVPLKAALGFLLSIAASLGVVVAIFQWGWLADVIGVTSPGPILSFLPIIMMALLFGLAMDYEVFLVSGVREHYVHTGDAKAAIRVGSAQAMRVVTAAALIMIFVFGAFVPEGSGVMKGIALGLAVGIALDAFLVRMTLGPALLALLGKAAWWLPRWISQLLPNVDVEGDGLRRHLTDVTWARQQRAAITAEGASLDGGGYVVGPFDVAVPAGAVLTLAGDEPARRLVAWLLAGRVDPVAGRLQVLGSPLPSERGRAQRRVALATAAPGESTVGALLAERLEFAAPWWKIMPSNRGERAWLARIVAALEAAELPAGEVTLDTPLSSLGPLEHSLVALAAALAERPQIACVETADGIGSRGLDRLLVAAGELAPASTTLVVSAASLPDFTARPPEPIVAGRPVVELRVMVADPAPHRKDVLT